MSLRFNLNPVAWIVGVIVFGIVYVAYTVTYPIIEELLTLDGGNPWLIDLMDQTSLFWDNATIILGAVAIAYIILSSISFEREEFYYG